MTEVEGEGMFRALVERSPDIIVRYDREGRRLYANPAWERLTGLAPDAVLGRTMPERPTVADPEGYHRLLMAALRGKVEETDIEFDSAALGLRYLHIRFVPEFDARGRATGVFVVGHDITERKRVERYVQERLGVEKELSRLTEVAPGVLFTFRRSGGRDVAMPYAAHKLVEVAGFWPEEVAEDAQPLLDIMHPEDIGPFLAGADASAESMLPWHAEFRLNHPLRGEVWIDWLATPGRQGGDLLWYGFMHDITERKRQEWELRLLHRAVDQASEALFVQDASQRFVFANERACRALGYSRAELASMTTSDIDPDVTKEMVDHAFATMELGKSNSFESRHRARDGRIFPVDITGAFFEEEGARYVVTTARDIAERKRMETALAESEREFRALAENLPDNIARWDAEGRYRYINPTHERTLGRSAAEVAGTVIPDSHSQVKAAVAQVVATGRAVHAVRQPVSVDGVEELHDVSLVPEFDAAGRVVGVLGLGRDMTAIYRLQDSVAAREREFRGLAENLPDSVIRYDLEQRIVFLNAPLVRDLGLADAGAVLGRRPMEVWPDGRFSVIDEAVARVVRGGEDETVELVWERAPGRFMVGQIRVVAERDENGEIVGTLAIGRDISAIREAERRLKHFIESLPGLAYTFHLAPDGTMGFPYVSTGIEAIYCITAEAAMADMFAIHGAVHPDDRPRIEAAIAESARTLAPFGIETRVCPSGRPERWIDVRSVPEFQADGGILWYGIMLDITERKRAEEALRRTEMRSREQSVLLRAVLEASPEVIAFALDKNYRYLAFNERHRQTMHAIWGKEIDVGANMLEAIGDHPDRHKARAGFDRVLAGESFVTEDTYGDEVLGRAYWQNFWAPIRGGDGAVTGLTCFVLNITESKAAELARETALAEALRLAGLRGAFMSQMSHELRTPLNGILGFAQLLQADADLTAATREWVDIIHDSADHLLGLINQILDYAKVEADRLELDCGEIQLDSFLNTVTAIVRVKAEQKRLAFACVVEAGLPAAILGDELRLRQILLNLLANAVKFTDQGEVCLTVSRPAPGRIRFETRDSGIGIAPDKLEAIFQPFEQAGDAGRAAHGTGLGLAISRRLARLMGGDIAVASEPGAGSRFALELPLAVVGEAAPSPASRVASVPPPAEPADLVIPPGEALLALHTQARRGDLRRIIGLTEAVAALDPRFAAFAGHVKTMAKGFRTRDLLDFLERCLEGSRDHA